MIKMGSGLVFCMLAGILESARYIAAAIYMSGGATQSRELYVSGLGYVGMRLEILAAVSICAGAALLIWAATDQCRK
ncbi:MAG: hypothetical protein IKF54_00100 [Eubacterium sp.]|nr:hypothetical protein [Eubacterium sp.]